MREARRQQAGFVISTEMMLISLVLVLGLITGWAKLRDQSLSEIKDSMAESWWRRQEAQFARSVRMKISKKLSLKKQSGFVVTAELLLITTILGLGLVTGFAKVRDQVLSELDDTGGAIGAINQSYGIVGTNWINGSGLTIAEVAGWAFNDDIDPDAPTAVGGDTTNVVYKAVPVPADANSDTAENYTSQLDVTP